MTEPLSIAYLREHGLDHLVAEKRLVARRHGTFANLVMLNYSQIDSDMADPIVQQCRGLILDEADDWRVVSWPYNKFFNYGEPRAAEIDWASATVAEKLDGSMMTLYHYAGAWHVASSGSPDASGSVGAEAMTFKQLFWRTWFDLGYVLPHESDWDSRYCYVFELMTPHNRVVVPHTKSRIVLHGARCLINGVELAPEVAAENGWEVVKTYDLGSIHCLIEAAKCLNPLEQEGYVVRDADFNRVEVKSPAYVRIHHLKDQMSVKNMVELVRTNESAEFLAYFPELKAEYDDVAERHRSLLNETIRVHLAMSLREKTQKEFAEVALGFPFSGALFALRAGKFETPEAYYRAMHIDSLLKLLGLKDAVPAEAVA